MLKRLLSLDKKLVLVGLFILYSFVFIRRSSFDGLDGSRYYCLFDDAMISLRYGWHLAHGIGPVWNPGERVEGYTNPLMVLVMAGVSLLFDQRLTVLVIQLLGILTVLGVAYLTASVAAELAAARGLSRLGLVKGLAFGATLAYFPLIFWSLMGMETGLLTLTLIGAVWLSFRYTRQPLPQYAVGAAGLLGLAYLARPDSSVIALLVLVYLGYAIWRGPLSWRAKWRIGLTNGAVYAAIIGVHLLFRWRYYGELVPNTYVLKMDGMPLIERLKNGLGFIEPFLTENWLVIGLSFGLLWLVRSWQTGLVAGIFVGLVGYQIYAGGDPWNYWRIITPAMPLVFALITVGLVQVAEDWLARPGSGRPDIKPRLIVTLTAVAMLVVVVGCNWRFLPEMTGTIPLHVLLNNQVNTEIGLALNQVTTPDATIGVVTAGAIPYWAERRSFDFLGKMDKYIATLPPDLSGAISWAGMNSVPGHNKYDLNYSIGELQPDFVEVFRWVRQDRTDLARKLYLNVSYKGVEFSLRRDSRAVLWDKVQLVP